MCLHTRHRGPKIKQQTRAPMEFHFISGHGPSDTCQQYITFCTQAIAAGEGNDNLGEYGFILIYSRSCRGQSVLAEHILNEDSIFNSKKGCVPVCM